MINLENLVSCERCGTVLDKNYLEPPEEPLNEYSCAVYRCPSCSHEVFDHE